MIGNLWTQDTKHRNLERGNLRVGDNIHHLSELGDSRLFNEILAEGRHVRWPHVTVFNDTEPAFDFAPAVVLHVKERRADGLQSLVALETADTFRFFQLGTCDRSQQISARTRGTAGQRRASYLRQRDCFRVVNRVFVRRRERLGRRRGRCRLGLP